MTSNTYKATIDLPSESSLLITRTFQAPKDLVFDALTKPELVRRWWGAGHGEVTICETDVREGGAWRFQLAQPDGTTVTFSGAYLELDPPARSVHTEHYEEGGEGAVGTITTTLDEHDGVTTMRALCDYGSREVRDAVIASGMETGMNASYDAMDDVLASQR